LSLDREQLLVALESIVPDKGKRTLIRRSAEKLKTLPFVFGVILFGSYARREATPISDIDLCVLDDPRSSKEKRLKALDYTSSTINISLFSELPLYVKFDVLSQGVVLSCRDEERLLDLRERVFLEYMDTRYLWEEPGAIERWLTGKK
jgi:hypothetical protein